MIIVPGEFRAFMWPLVKNMGKWHTFCLLHTKGTREKLRILRDIERWLWGVNCFLFSFLLSQVLRTVGGKVKLLLCCICCTFIQPLSCVWVCGFKSTSPPHKTLLPAAAEKEHTTSTKEVACKERLQEWWLPFLVLHKMSTPSPFKKEHCICLIISQRNVSA